MGRIKTKLIKRVSQELIKEHGESFTKNFDENKLVAQQHADIPSKKIRNIIAGYITRLRQ